MAIEVMHNARWYLGDYDLSGEANEITVDMGGEALDHLPLNADGWVRRYAGALKADLDGRGVLDRDTWHAVQAYARAGTAVPTAIFEVAPVLGALALLAEGRVPKRMDQLQVGQLGQVELAFRASGRVMLGWCLGALTLIPDGTTNGVALELPGVAADRSLYVAVFVLGVFGDQGLEVRVESDADDTFAAPVERLSITPTGRAGTWHRVAGPITDTTYRLATTVTDGPISVPLVVVVGVG